MSHEREMLQPFQHMGNALWTVWIKPFAKNAAWLFSLPVEVFIHIRFGVRYLGILAILIAYVVFLFTADFLIQNAASQPDATDHGLMPWFGNAFLITALAHRLYAGWLARRGERWHSYSAGLSFGFWQRIGISDAMAQKYVEPALIFGLSLLVAFYDVVLAGYLFFSSIALFLKNQFIYAQVRKAFLDRQDSRIEAEIIAQMTRSMTTPSLRDAKGFVVPMSFSKSAARSEEDSSIADRLAQIDPALARYVEQAGGDALDGDDSARRNSSESS